MKVLITGIAGDIGGIVADSLQSRHDVTGIDVRPSKRTGAAVADLTDMASILPRFQDIEVVVHLAAERRHTPDIGWDLLQPKNIVATANVFQAAHESGVRRVVFASSMHVMGQYENHAPYAAIAAGDYAGLDPADVALVSGDMPVRPDGRYAASKAFGESLGRYYAESEGMEVICVRVGTLSRDDRPGSDPRSYVSWFSKRDAAQFFSAAVEVPGIRYEILYGASGNTWKIYDTPRAWEVLGIQPRDNAEEYRPVQV